MNVMRQFEGGEPIDQCWASRQPWTGTEYDVCSSSKVNHLGLCAEHALAITGPGLIRP